MSPWTAIKIRRQKTIMRNVRNSFNQKLDTICDKLFGDIGNPYALITAKCDADPNDPRVIQVIDDLWDIVHARHESRWILIRRSIKTIPREERIAIGRQLVASPAPVVEEFSDKIESLIDFADPLLFDVFNAASEYLDRYLQLETAWVADILELIHAYRA